MTRAWMAGVARLGAVALVGSTACGGTGTRSTGAFELDGSGTGESGQDGSTSGGLDPTEGGTIGLDDGSGDGPDSGLDTSTGGPSFDCSPAWMSTWIGSPCDADADCAYDGGFCLFEDEGFPCGTCSLPCDEFCRDMAGAPTTFCVDGGDIGVDPGGYCLSRCDPALLGGSGCRDGYVCSPLPRYNDPSVEVGVCVPDEFGGEAMTPCQQILLDLGAVFVPVDHTPESPAGHPELLCVVEDPVLLYSPVGDVALRYISANEEAPVFLGCEAAVSVVGSAAVAWELGADELLHIGTYNCRVISGTSTLSQHGLGNAIDIAGFVLSDGTEVTVLDDWEDGNPMPVTPLGQLLRSFTDQIWALGLWNIILTPEYNADHDNHFHVDLTPGGNTYQ